MATDKLTKEVTKDFPGLVGKARYIDKASLKPPTDWIGRILEERQRQREKVFSFAIHSSHATLVFLVVLIAIQSFYRIFTQDFTFSFFSGYELEVFSVGVFSQVIGLVYIIAKRLWDDSTYTKYLDKKANSDVSK